MVRTFTRNDSQLQGEAGAIAVLHTHSRRLDFHPHVHLVVPAAAIDPDRKLWRTKGGKRGYLFNHKSRRHSGDRHPRLQERPGHLPLPRGQEQTVQSGLVTRAIQVIRFVLKTSPPHGLLQHPVQPIENQGHASGHAPDLAVLVGLVVAEECEERLRAPELVVEGAGVGQSQEMIAVGADDQGRAPDVLDHVLQGEFPPELHKIQWSRRAGSEQAILDPPAKAHIVLHLGAKLLVGRVRVSEHLFPCIRRRALRTIEVELAGIGNANGQTVFEGGGTRGQKTTHAEAHERHLAGVDLRAAQGVVHHRSDHVFPVMAEVQPLLQERSPLSRALEDKHVVSAVQGEDGGEVEFLARTVKAGLKEQRLFGRGAAVGLEEVTGQGRILVRDADRLHGPRHERCGLPKGLAAEVRSFCDAGIGRVTVQEKGGGTVVVAGTQQGLTRRNLLSLAQCPGCVGVDASGESVPGIEPGVAVTRHNGMGGEEAFVDVRAARDRIADVALQLIIEGDVLEYEHGPGCNRRGWAAQGTGFGPKGGEGENGNQGQDGVAVHQHGLLFCLMSDLAFCFVSCANNTADPRVMQTNMLPDVFQSVPAAGVGCCNGLVSIGVQADVLGQRLGDAERGGFRSSPGPSALNG